MDLTVQSLLQVLANKDYPVADFNIIGIRYFDNINQFTDKKIVLRKVDGNWDLHTWNQTTKPGLEALKTPMNIGGCGTLKEGYYKDCWVIGYHKYVKDLAHRALIQCVAVLPVYRDKERDGIIRYDEQHLVNNGSGIDHHGTWEAILNKAQTEVQKKNVYDYNIALDYIYPTVGTWSEACQVMQEPKQQQEFMDLCDWAALNLKLEKFSYILINEKDLC